VMVVQFGDEPVELDDDLHAFAGGEQVDLRADVLQDVFDGGLGLGVVFLFEDQAEVFYYAGGLGFRELFYFYLLEAQEQLGFGI
jgi:hypothetical protein